MYLIRCTYIIAPFYTDFLYLSTTALYSFLAPNNSMYIDAYTAMELIRCTYIDVPWHTHFNDCFIFFSSAKRLNCTNADWPDHYGHYREAKYTQIKHHWWWKANQVFARLQAAENYNGNLFSIAFFEGPNLLGKMKPKF